MRRHCHVPRSANCLPTLTLTHRLHYASEAGELPDTVREYAKSLAVWESHSLEPFVIFLQRLADKSNLVGEVILEGGTMDYLLHLYISNFSDPLAKKDPGGFHRISTLYAGCNSLLLVLSSTRRGVALICRHPFHILWSNRPELPFTPLALDRMVQRRQIWKLMDKQLVLWRIHSMMEMMMDWRRPYEQELLMDTVADILDFSG